MIAVIPNSIFLLSLLHWWPEGALRHLCSVMLCSAQIGGTREGGQLMAVQTHSQGDGNHPPGGSPLLLPVSIYFQHLFDAVFNLLPIALLWLVGHYLIFVRKESFVIEISILFF